MKTLTLIRHAKSCWENQELHDLVRPLNGRGMVSIPLIGNHLKENNIHPDLIYTSPATRALHTAIGVGGILGCHPEDFQINQEIYFGDATSIIELIKSTNNIYRDVFLFGHDNFLADIVFELTTERPAKFPTCAAYRMQFETDNWQEIKNGKKIMFVYPKQFVKV